MIDPSLPLQAALVAAIKAAGSVVGQKVYDKVPTTNGIVPESLYPFVSLGPMSALDQSDTCHSVAEVSAQIDVWSRAVGGVQAKEIAALVLVALDAPLTVTGFAVVVHEVEIVRYGREPDGLTSRAIISMRYELTPTA